MSFGEKLKDLRIKAGMSQEQLAKELGITRRSIVYYETSERYLSTHSLHKEFKEHGGCLKEAIKNANNSVKSREEGKYNFTYTEIGKLITELGIKEEV